MVTIFDFPIHWTSVCLSLLVSRCSRSLLANASLIAQILALVSSKSLVRYSLIAPMTSSRIRTRRLNFLDITIQVVRLVGAVSVSSSALLIPVVCSRPSARSFCSHHRLTHSASSPFLDPPDRRAVSNLQRRQTRSSLPLLVQQTMAARCYPTQSKSASLIV